MGKSSSKLSVDSISRHSTTTQHQDRGCIRSSMASLIETDLSHYSTDAQLSHVLTDQQLLLPFLNQVFYREVEQTDCMQTLFRGNCLASRIMSHCFRTFGSGYLKQLLEPHIQPLTAHGLHASLSSPIIAIQQLATNAQLTRSRCSSVTTPETNATNRLKHDKELGKSDLQLSYEVDAARLNESDELSINQDNLLKLTSRILRSILLSSEDFPPQLKSMCACLLRVLKEKFHDPDTCIKAIGTVVFLRFINPAIVSPYEFGIVAEQPSPKVMRGLTLVSKILQNIANNVEFSKEEHMLPFNNFVRQQFEPLRNWITDISSERNTI